MVDYYSQRASHPGTLLITESIIIAQAAGGLPTPAIYTPEHIAGWKKVVDAVHAKGSFLFLQLFAAGRGAMLEVGKAEDPNFEIVSSGNLPLAEGMPAPKPLSTAEIKQYVEYYAAAAKAFVEGAGGDGVEIHFAHGCLVDQFLSNKVNNRTDAYGGSAENRSRFALEVMDAVVKAVGPRKVAFRIAPFSDYLGVKMEPSDIQETFAYLVKEIKRQHPELAYLHAVLPRMSASEEREVQSGETLEPLLKLWAPKPILIAGGIAPTLAGAEEEANKHENALAVYGRYFISNPDLVSRIKLGVEARAYNRATFYIPFQLENLEGYTSYPVEYGPDGKLE